MRRYNIDEVWAFKPVLTKSICYISIKSFVSDNDIVFFMIVWLKSFVIMCFTFFVKR